MEELDLQTSVKRNPELVAVDMDGETVMMDVNSGQYFGLDPVGSLVWAKLEEPHSVASVAADVRAAFEVGEDDDVEGDMLAFLSDLLESRLVQIAPAA